MAMGRIKAESLPDLETTPPVRSRMASSQWGSVICGMNCRKICEYL